MLNYTDGAVIIAVLIVAVAVVALHYQDKAEKRQHEALMASLQHPTELRQEDEAFLDDITADL